MLRYFVLTSSSSFTDFISGAREKAGRATWVVAVALVVATERLSSGLFFYGSHSSFSWDRSVLGCCVRSLSSGYKTSVTRRWIG
mmetsp:Transcript_20905/g.39232  ORF Transcript_20905/g.39232 Transcript_20905/m.39232 type:complete len:84 (-) Transcript_20905:800-1051(-)